MRKSGGFAARFTGIDTQKCVQEWRRRYPYKTAQYVSERYGAPIRTVENWLSLASSPNGHWLGVIVEVEDPEFMVAVMRRPPAYLVQAARDHQIREAEDSVARARQTLERLTVPA